MTPRFFVCALLLGACSTAPPPAQPRPNADAAGEAGLRRLTAAQYRRAVAELLVADPEGIGDLDEELRYDARLPSERKVHGFEHYGAVQRPSAALVEAHLRGSIRAAIEGETLCDGSPDDCRRAMLQMARRAFRGPLTDPETAELTALYDRFDDPFEGMFVATQWVLLHPRFLYLIERGAGAPDDAGRIALTDHEIATRLAFFLWGSLPDDTLLDAADAGTVHTPEQVATQAARMLDDPRARHGMVELHRQWLDFERVERLNPDFLSFELFRVIDDPNDAEISQIRLRNLIVAMRTEMERFVEMEFFEGTGTLRGLLTSTRTYGGELLRYLYGRGPVPTELREGEEDEEPCDPEEDPECEPEEAPPPCDGRAAQEDCAAGPGVIELDPTRRAGFLTLASHLAAHSYPRHPAPIRRSVFVLERFLCAPPPPPPPGIDPSGVAGGQDTTPRTNRERHAAHTTNAFCADCHARIDPIGFAFERYDAVGAFRREDNGFPIDSSGDLTALDMEVRFEDGVALSRALAESPRVQDCVSRQWMRYALGHDIREGDLRSLTQASEAFRNADGSFRELALSIVQTESFLTREVTR